MSQWDMDNELSSILVREFGKDKERYKPYPAEKQALGKVKIRTA